MEGGALRRQSEGRLGELGAKGLAGACPSIDPALTRRKNANEDDAHTIMMMIIMMMEGGAPRRQAIARVGKGLRIFRPSQLDFGRQLSFSPYARAVESRCWPTMRRRD